MRRAVNRSSKRRRMAARERRDNRPVAATASSLLSTTKPVSPSSTISGAAPPLNAITGVPQASASMNTNPKRSGQAVGASSAMAPLRKLDFSASPISPMYSTSGGREQFAYFGFEIVAVDRVDLGCDLQRHAAALGDPDRLIDSLFRRNPTEKGKVPRRNGLRRQEPLR